MAFRLLFRKSWATGWMVQCSNPADKEIFVVDNFQTGSRARLSGYQLKKPEREVSHFQLSRAEVKNDRNCTCSPAICFSCLCRNNCNNYECNQQDATM
jgi:hypothetical protein